MDCNLDVYTDYLISSTGQTSATALSRLYQGQMSHDQVTRFLTHSYFDSRDIWLKSKPLVRSWEAKRKKEDFAVLIVDDSRQGHQAATRKRTKKRGNRSLCGSGENSMF